MNKICWALALGAVLWLMAGSPVEANEDPISPLRIPPVNLLENPSFEGDYHSQDGIPEVNVPDGWRAWYMDHPPCRPLKPGCDLVCPSNCMKASSSSVFSGTDGLLTLSPVTLTVGQAARLTVTLVTTKPLQAADLYLFINPVVYTVSEMALLDGYAKLWWARGIIRYDREVPTGTVGIVPLFALTLMPALTDSVHVEIVYWLWADSGGMYETAWAGVASPPRRFSVLAAAGSPSCVADTGCYWARPEFVPTVRSERVRSGETAQKYFTVGRMHSAGLSQTVTVTPGLWYRFSAWMQAWQCYDWLVCCDKRPTCISDAPASMNLAVGVDTLGGRDPLSGSVIWGHGGESFDQWGQFSVLAQAVTDTLTVFTRSDVRFGWARDNNDVYLDDAILEVVHPLWIPLVEVE